MELGFGMPFVADTITGFALAGEIVNGLPDKTGETRKDVYFKTKQCQWTTAEVRSDFI